MQPDRETRGGGGVFPAGQGHQAGTVLVVGGSGFVGAHLVEVLKAHGHRVRIVDRQPPAICGGDYVRLEMRDLPEHPEVFRGVEAVYHLAWSTIPQTSNLDPVVDIQENLSGSVRLLEAGAAAGVRKVIFLSSGGTVYGLPQEIPIPEEHPCHPLCSYGITKLAFENYLEMYRLTRGQDYVIIRGSNAYGAGQDLARPLGAPGVFLDRVRRGADIEIWGDGRTVRDFLYVEDLAQALYRSMRYQPPDKGVRLFNAGSGLGVSLAELLEAVAAVTGQRPRVTYLPPRPLDVPINILDTRRIRAVLGWQPQIDLREGLGRTWQWLQGRGDRER